MAGFAEGLAAVLSSVNIVRSGIQWHALALVVVETFLFLSAWLLEFPPAWRLGIVGAGIVIWIASHFSVNKAITQHPGPTVLTDSNLLAYLQSPKAFGDKSHPLDIVTTANVGLLPQASSSAETPTVEAEEI